MEENAMNLNVVIIGGSAGSLEVLLTILPQFTQAPSFATVIVLHRKNTEDTLLEDLFSHKTIIPVVAVEDKIVLEAGKIYIAPSDYHLLFENNRDLSLDTSEKVNYSRPSIDVSFESAAEVYRESLTAILLSGANVDGTNGLLAVQKMGGKTIIQAPDSAEMPFMPENALRTITPDHVLNPMQILDFLKTHTFEV